MNPILTSPNKCPACDRENFIHVRNLKGQRSGNNLRLYLFKNCHSLFNPSSYVEDEKALKSDLEWHIDWFDYNSNKAPVLLKKLKTLSLEAKTFLDIGCGIGATVLKAQSLGMIAEEVEPNHFAVKYGKKNFL